MVKKNKSLGTNAKVGIVIYTDQGILIPSAATLAKMKAAEAKAVKKRK